MGMRENFKTAVKELLPEEKPSTAEPAEGDLPRESAATFPAADSVAAPAAPERATSAAPVQRTEIAAGVTVHGTIQGAGSMDIRGQWIGDIDIEEDLRLYGGLNGNLSARSLLLNSGRIRGDVRLAQRADVDANSVILGNVQVGELNLQGRIKGDVTVKGQLTMGSAAVVAGQITAGRILVAAGAALQGKVQIAEPNAEALFRDVEEKMKHIPDPFRPAE